MQLIMGERKRIATFTILSYIDKGLAFILPLLILYFYNDKQSYNELEYAYSIANIVVYMFSVGSIYSFYSYSKASDKKKNIDQYKCISSYSLVIVSLLFIFISPFIYKWHYIGLLVYALIAARTIYLLFVSFFSSYYRLSDIPERILYYTIGLSIIIVLLFFFFSLFSIKLLFSFIVSEFVLPVVFCVIVLCFCQKIKLELFLSYYKEAFAFAWPVILNCFLGLGITNFGKIYAFNYMSADDMYVFSYTMRISMIIGMAHNSIVAYYAKRIYIYEFNKNIAFLYLSFLVGSAILCFVVILSINSILPQKLPIDITMVIIFLYNIIYCIGSFCEAFYGRLNKNRMILYYSLFSASIFIIMIANISYKTLYNISLSMLLFAFIRMIVMIGGLVLNKKNRIEISS